MQRLLISLLGLAVVAVWVFYLAASPAQAKTFSRAAIYYNEACGGCNVYLKEKLIPFLEKQGIRVEMFDYLNDKSARQAMNQWQERLGIPFELQSHIMTFLDEGEVVLGGHIPLAIVAEVLAVEKLPSQLTIFQDQMLEMGIDPAKVNYFVWQPGLAIKEYPLSEPLGTYLSEWQAGNIPAAKDSKHKSLWPLILSAGLLDGINPCAIAVLLFFVAFLFTLRSSIGRIFVYGLVYIAVIYLTYLGIGLGLFRAVVLSSEPHLMAKIGASLVIVLGLINIINVYWQRFPLKLQIPKFSQGTLKHWLTRATLPAVIVGAFLVGLCTFPCSGGIYVAIVSLLAAQRTFWQGLGYLVVYNIMFILPLLALLALAGNRYVLGQVAAWQSRSDQKVKLASGGLMIVLGIIIWLWFI